MANKIAIGTTGQASFSSTNVYGVQPPGYWAVYLSSGDVTSLSPSGWNVSESGLVTIPTDAGYDGYEGKITTCKYQKNVPGPPGPINTYLTVWYVFTIVCMTVVVSITKLSSASIPGSNPVEYEHKYVVQAEAQGGTDPKTYAWSTSVGLISGNGPSVTLTITNSNPTSAGITGTVTCNVTDSGTCDAEDSASIADGNPTIEGWWPCPETGDSKKDCGCDKTSSASLCQTDDCAKPTGVFTASSFGSDPAEYKNYAGGSAPSPAWGIARH